MMMLLLFCWKIHLKKITPLLIPIILLMNFNYREYQVASELFSNRLWLLIYFLAFPPILPSKTTE